MQATYLILSVLGMLLPLSQFVPWLVKNRLAVPLLIQEAFGSPISAFAWADVLVSAVVVLVFIRAEGRRLRISSRWVPVVALCLVGVSLALPLFLFMRERHIARRA
jgi:hypothetical protein